VDTLSRSDDPATTTVPFGPLAITVDATVLQPRPWTYAQSAWAQELLADLPDGDVLELCSGAGQIGLGAVHGTGRALVMVDMTPRACELARLNAGQVEEPVDVREGRFDAVLADAERFVLVVADPPWVPTQRVDDHPDDPVWAIDGGLDGLEVARRCVKVAADHLADGGRVLVQLGSREQVDVLSRTLEAVGLRVAEVREGGEDASRGVVALLQPFATRG
jgi:methylase of polypeptide subunit release factors